MFLFWVLHTEKKSRIEQHRAEINCLCSASARWRTRGTGHFAWMLGFPWNRGNALIKARKRVKRARGYLIRYHRSLLDTLYMACMHFCEYTIHTCRIVHLKVLARADFRNRLRRYLNKKSPAQPERHVRAECFLPFDMFFLYSGSTLYCVFVCTWFFFENGTRSEASCGSKELTWNRARENRETQTSRRESPAARASIWYKFYFCLKCVVLLVVVVFLLQIAAGHLSSTFTWWCLCVWMHALKILFVFALPFGVGC